MIHVVPMYHKTFKGMFCRLEEIEESLSDSSSYDLIDSLSYDSLSTWWYRVMKKEFTLLFAFKEIEWR